MINQQELFYGGRWRPADSSETISVRSANTGEPIGSVPLAGPGDVAAAVGAARAAFDEPGGWAHWAPGDRAAALHRLADALDKRAPEIARRVSEQNGMPISTSSAAESRMAGHFLHYYASLLEADEPTEKRPSTSGGTTLVRRVPLGVVANIAPFNFPNTLAALKYAPALAAGCTMVVKPSPETVLDAILVAEAIMEAGLPDGVLNILPGDRDTGARLVAHPGVDMVTFTGSTVSGRQIGEVCGRLLRPVTLELGGKSAAIVLDDANLDPAAVGQQLIKALYDNNGQTCFITSRVLAPRSRYDEIVDIITALTRSLKVGNSLDPATQIGPLVSERQRDRVEGYITKGKEQGARLVTGGRRPAGQPAGWFVEPTVFADVDNSSTIAQEEIFGPVVTITPYNDDDEAVRLANDSAYGLAGTVWTTDTERGLGVARRIVTGTVGLNHYVPDLNSPTTMTKASGIGIKFGPEGLESYRRFQAIYL
jgi:acyl-CoA reductase-like NAD-dependent aldehyde dehydrogenase